MRRRRTSIAIRRAILHRALKGESTHSRAVARASGQPVRRVVRVRAALVERLAA